MRIFMIDPVAQRLLSFERSPEEVKHLCEKLMVYPDTLSYTDVLYAVEQPLMGHWFRIGFDTIHGNGMIVGEEDGKFLDAPRMTELEITQSLTFGAQDETVLRTEGYFFP